MLKIAKFTFVQHVSTKSYRISTVLIASLILLIGFFGFSAIDMISGTETVSDIDRVYVCDTSILKGTDYSVLHESENELYENVEFTKAESDSPEDAVKEAAEYSSHACVLEVKNDESGNFIIRVIKPEGFDAGKKSAKFLSGFISDNFRYAIYENVGLTEVQKEELLTGSEYEVAVAGEEGDGLLEDMEKNIIPLFLGIILYMMLCIYGQSAARCVVIEKDSKMMESLLVMTKPYHLIFGKIAGMFLAAVLQLTIWILAIIGGVSSGISASSGAGQEVKKFIALLAEKGGFTPLCVVTGIVILLSGFFLFISLAALSGSFASKTEEINNYFGVYTMAIVVCWMFPYINQLNGNEHMMGILRYIPFTAPFTVPADVVVGNMSVGGALISGVLVLAASALAAYVAGRVYKALVLYRGEPVKMKDIFKIIKNS